MLLVTILRQNPALYDFRDGRNINLDQTYLYRASFLVEISKATKAHRNPHAPSLMPRFSKTRFVTSGDWHEGYAEVGVDLLDYNY